MATRSIVRIIPSKAMKQKDCYNAASRYIYLYHHWDGSPSGVGRELEHFLRGRNDGDAPDDMPTWDANRIAEELVNSPSSSVTPLVHSAMLQRKQASSSNGINGVTVGRTSMQKNGCASMVWTSRTAES